MRATTIAKTDPITGPAIHALFLAGAGVEEASAEEVAEGVACAWVGVVDGEGGEEVASVWFSV